MGIKIIFTLLIVAQVTWASDDALEGFTICLRTMSTYFPDYKTLVSLHSREFIIVSVLIGKYLKWNCYKSIWFLRNILSEGFYSSRQNNYLIRMNGSDDTPLLAIKTTGGGAIQMRLKIFQYVYYSFLQGNDESPFILPKKWHHFCLSFSESTNQIIEVLVSIKNEFCVRYLFVYLIWYLYTVHLKRITRANGQDSLVRLILQF